MSTWDSYPNTYRQSEVQAASAAARAGECCAVIGLSGSGKSNLLGFMANRLAAPDFVLVDCNRLPPGASAQQILTGLFGLICTALGVPTGQTFAEASAAIQQRLTQKPGGLCLLFDRFDALTQAAVASAGQAAGVTGQTFGAAAGNLRALRDLYKYDLTYIIAARRPLDAHNELAELFYAHTLWLGPLSPQDAVWSANRYAQRLGQTWDAGQVERLVQITAGYPSFLRAACEASAAGCPAELQQMAAHPAVSRRLAEFLADQPTPPELAASRLTGLPLLALAGLQTNAPAAQPTAELTAKEHLLYSYFQTHPQQVCEKDDLIHAVWPEDVIYQTGIRDDSLAQLVRRLREKVEQNPSSPQHILTVPGRGYRYIP